MAVAHFALGQRKIGMGEIAEDARFGFTCERLAKVGTRLAVLRTGQNIEVVLVGQIKLVVQRVGHVPSPAEPGLLQHFIIGAETVFIGLVG